MSRDPAADPLKNDVLEAADGERRTVHAVTFKLGQTMVTYVSSHNSDGYEKKASLPAWKRWVEDHAATLIAEQSHDQ